MITINQNGTHVQVAIEHSLTSEINNESVFLFWNANSRLFAELMTNQLNKLLEERVEEIRKQEYERGWKHAKAKKKKATWFSVLLKKCEYND